VTASSGQRSPVVQSQWAAADGVETGPAPGWKYGGFWIRFLAYILDELLIWILIVGTYLALGGRGSDGPELDDTATTILGVVGLVLFVLYFPLWWGLKGHTPGMVPFGLRVRRTDGSRIGLGRAFLRFLGYIIAAIPLYLGLIWAGFDRRKQGWHDKIADTVVVRPG
jgi:uncharacterized RDD family membrane protein YckC